MLPRDALHDRFLSGTESIEVSEELRPAARRGYDECTVRVVGSVWLTPLFVTVTSTV